MAHGHHHHPDHHGDDRGRRGLGIALALTLGIFGAEVAGGLIGGSLALLADAGHLLTDAASIGLALMAARMAARPPSGRRTFGWQRAEILAALANGVVLVVIVLATLFEAGRRFQHPPRIDGGLTLAVALVGLAFNLASARVLMGSGDGINVRAALRHVLADALSSAGVIIAATIVLVAGWRYADPLASMVIVALILVSAVGIVRESVDVLMEAAPPGIDVERLGQAMAAVEGVVEVHDLHVWTVTSGFPAVAAHVTVRGDAEPSIVRRRTAEMLRKHFGIEHTTLQAERAGEEHRLLQIKRRG
ncbi:MAG: cation diffusion facilitator family transporter [Gaiellales bacterium]